MTNMIVTEEATKRILEHPGMVEFVTEVNYLVDSYFRNEPHRLYVCVYHDPEIDHSFIFAEVRLAAYDDNCMRRIKEIRKLYRNFRLVQDSGFLLSTNFQYLE